ncbi:cone-rod homeobox protein-like [Choloepus didactylus]|uniref:cone-rod homeobox protein-like n=1 Tax=Choloepus didactylus TaxID=27675 RepID=UPI00189D5378|nr:cone-rod homeobox protein-like [Choloepus didactylus]
MDPSPSSGPQRRLRQERTVFSKEQQQELERRFADCKYPGYEARTALAARLSLNQHRVQVWFKNRRAKFSRQMKQQQQRQRPPGQLDGQLGARGAPGSCPGAPTPAPAGPEFPVGADVRSPPPPSPLGIFAAPEPAVSSQGPAWGTPAQGTPRSAPSAPGPAWARDPRATGLLPDPALFPDFTELLAPQDPFRGSSLLPKTSGYQAASGFVDGNDSAPRHY